MNKKQHEMIFFFILSHLETSPHCSKGKILIICIYTDQQSAHLNHAVKEFSGTHDMVCDNKWDINADLQCE